jgi:hypothetical protein
MKKRDSAPLGRDREFHNFCPLALIRRASNFLQKSFLDPQHVISSLNFAR